MSSEKAFERWWEEEGSHMSTEKGVLYAAKVAWMNGGYVQQQIMNEQLRLTMQRTSYTCKVG